MGLLGEKCVFCLEVGWRFLIRVMMMLGMNRDWLGFEIYLGESRFRVRVGEIWRKLI